MDLEELEEARKNLESQILQKEQERREIEKQIASLEQEREKANNKRRFGQISRILNRKRVDKTNELMDLRYELSKKEKNIENLKEKMSEVEEKKEMTALGLYQLSDLEEAEKKEMQVVEEETSLVPLEEKEEFKKMDQINNNLRKQENLILFDSLASKYYIRNYLEDLEKIKRNELMEQLKELIETINKESIKQLTKEEIKKLNDYEETIKKYQEIEENYLEERKKQQERRKEIEEKITIYKNDDNYYVNNYVLTRFLNKKSGESIELNGKKLYLISKEEVELLENVFNNNINNTENQNNFEEMDSYEAAASATEEEPSIDLDDEIEDIESNEDYEIDEEDKEEETQNELEEEKEDALDENSDKENTDKSKEEKTDTIDETSNVETQKESEKENLDEEEKPTDIETPKEEPEDEKEEAKEKTETTSPKKPEQEEEKENTKKELRSSDIVYQSLIMDRIKKVQDKIALLRNKENGLLKHHVEKEIRGYEVELEKLEKLAKETRMEFTKEKEDRLDRLDHRYKKNQEKIHDYENKIKQLNELKEQLLTIRKKRKVDKDIEKIRRKIDQLKQSNVTCQSRQRRTMMSKVNYENTKRILLSFQEGKVNFYSDDIKDNERYREEIKNIMGNERKFAYFKDKYYEKRGIYYKKKLEKASFILDEMQQKDTVIEILGARVTSLPKRFFDKIQESETMNREPSLSM